MYKVTYYRPDVDICDQRWFGTMDEMKYWIEAQKNIEPNTKIISIELEKRL